MDPGHVFVVRGDLTKLACDGWLLPTDSVFDVTASWSAARATDLTPQPWRVGERVRRVPGVAAGRPQPYYTNIHRGPNRLEGFVESARDFVRFAREGLANEAPLHGRERRLLAMPVVGTGYGGGHRDAGTLMTMLLPALEAEVAEAGAPVDVAVVAFAEPQYDAAQAVRRDRPWPLSSELQEAARGLAQRADQGKLVLFLGAGVGMSAGLPSWEGLLAAVAERLDDAPTRHEGFGRLSVEDQASLLERSLARRDGERSLGKLVAELLKERTHPSLMHFLLAALPASETITTNYDRLFETAYASGARPRALSVLPDALNPGADAWLLKLHGCIGHPEQIVLTRADYLRYEHRRGALAGIVQAMLLTKHMLFVGFSLRDGNFHRIVDEVRRALPVSARGPSKFGTALGLAPEPLMEDLWCEDLDFVALDDGSERRRAARRAEVFLDYLACQTQRAPSYLLDPDWRGLLTEAEQRLADELRTLATRLQRAPDPDGRGWREVVGLLARLGSR